DVDAERRLAQRGGVEAVQGEHDRVIVTLLALHVDKRLGARAARLVDRRHRNRSELVLRDDALEEANRLVRAAALAGHDDELDRLLRLPGEGLRRAKRRHPESQRETEAEYTTTSLDHHIPPLMMRGRGRAPYRDHIQFPGHPPI